MIITPDTDGFNHINVYSRGKTELGRQLSNFSFTPFVHPTFGYFASMEAYWYWVKTGMVNDGLRNLSGFAAKKVGGLNKAVPCDNFEQYILEGIECKIRQNWWIIQALVNSYLTLTHYYAYGSSSSWKIISPTSSNFQIEFLEDLRYQLKIEFPNY